MNNIPTAEEFILQYLDASPDELAKWKERINALPWADFDNITDWMEQYAILKSKFYVEAALKAAVQKGRIIVSPDLEQDESTERASRHIDYLEISEKSILNAYPLTNVI